MNLQITQTHIHIHTCTRTHTCAGTHKHTHTHRSISPSRTSLCQVLICSISNVVVTVLLESIDLFLVFVEV